MGFINNVNVDVRGAAHIAPCTYKTIVLKQNITKQNLNVLTQNMLNEYGKNTKFVIKWDYVLGEDITIPENCILEFDGGSISGEHTITGQNTGINAGLVKIFSTDITLVGTWNVAEAYPEWFGAKGDGVTNDTSAIQKSVYFPKVIFSKALYIITSPIECATYNNGIVLEGLISNRFGRNVCIKNTTANSGIFWVTNLSTPGQVTSPIIKNLNLIADYPIKLNSYETGIIVDGSGSNIPYGMVPQVINCSLSPLSSGHIGIGISWTKQFDGRIEDCEIRSFDKGIFFLGSDLNIISNNRILDCNYMICDFAVGTFGSQNEIHHNDLLHPSNNGNGTYIKTNSKQVRIYDNYLEGAAKYAIDCTNIDFETIGVSTTLSDSLFSIITNSNRFETPNCIPYRINNKYRYIKIYEICVLIYSTANPIKIVDTNGNESFLNTFVPAIYYNTFDITIDRFVFSNVTKLLKDRNNTEKGYILDNTIRTNWFSNNFYQYIKNDIIKNNFVIFANSSTMFIDEDLTGKLHLNTTYIYQVKAKVHTPGTVDGIFKLIRVNNKVGYSSAISINLTDDYQIVDIHLTTQSTNSNAGLAILQCSVDLDLQYIKCFIADYGTTVQRPPVSVVEKGFKYLDTTLNKPIWSDGTNWVDATGATV